MKRALVVGGGASGLAAARGLFASGWQVTLVEASSRVGGCLRTEAVGGYRLEAGATTVRDTAALRALCDAVGQGDALVPPDPAAKKRYVVRGGRVRALPGKPPELLTSPLFSLGGRLRLLSEAVRGGDPGPDEPFAAFVRRRFGRQAVPLADAMVQGVYAGDPARLAVGWAFPRVWQMVESHGSVLRGLAARRGAASPTIIGFRGGFGALAEALSAGLDVRLGLRAEQISRTQGRGFEVTCTLDGNPELLAADAVVCALPARAAARWLSSLGDTDRLDQLPHAPVAVVALGYERAQIRHPLDGFGLLAPHAEGRRILGCLFTSSLFADRAPEGRVLLTVMLGGARRAEWVDRGEEELIRVAKDEVGELLGIDGAPELARLFRWQPGIVQPTAAWPAAQAQADQIEADHPGLTLLGGWRTGVGVPDCLEAGWELSRRPPS